MIFVYLYIIGYASDKSENEFLLCHSAFAIFDRYDNEQREMKLLLADNQAITRAGLVHLFAADPRIAAIGTVTDKRELVRELMLSDETLVILDYTLFDFGGIDEVVILRERFPRSRWLFFSDSLSDPMLERIVRLGYPFGIVLKGCSEEEIAAAFETALRGERFLCSQVSNLLLERRRPDMKTPLTGTEREILHEIALGKSSKRIAAERNLSVHTVVTHKKNIFRKLEVNNVHEASRYAMRAGIIDAAEYCI